jgi:hypothetical protein
LADRDSLGWLFAVFAINMSPITLTIINAGGIAMKRHSLIFTFLLFLAAPASAQVACTMDAKQCPDGSYVSRTGPNCEFAPCPGEGGGDAAAGKDTGDDKKKPRRVRPKNQLLNREILQGTDGRTAGHAGDDGGARPEQATPPENATPPVSMPAQPPPRLYNNISPREEELYRQPAESKDQSRYALDSWLSRFGGTESGRIGEYSNGAVSDLFSGYRFYTMRFPAYPAARAVPEPLKTSNVFAVSESRVVTHIPDEAYLQSFFMNALPRLPNENRQRDALRAWLALVQELQQDPNFRFSQPDSIAVTSNGDGWSVSGKIDVIQGGRGEISTTLYFDAGGNFLKAETDTRLLPGARTL